MKMSTKTELVNDKARLDRKACDLKGDSSSSVQYPCSSTTAILRPDFPRVVSATEKRDILVRDVKPVAAGSKRPISPPVRKPRANYSSSSEDEEVKLARQQEIARLRAHRFGTDGSRTESAALSKPAAKSDPPKKQAQVYKDPTRRPKRAAGGRRDLNNLIDRESKVFKCDKAYLAGISKGFFDANAIKKFNSWVKANRRDLSHDTLQACHHCGTMQHYLCDHFITKVPTPAPPVAAVVKPSHPAQAPLIPTWRLRDPLTWFMPSGILDLSKQDETDYHTRQDCIVDSQYIISDLYNYLLLKKEVKYENREQMLIHLKKLATVWLKDNMTVDTNAVHCMLATVGKVADETTTQFLLRERSHHRVFSATWLNSSMHAAASPVRHVSTAFASLRNAYNGAVQMTSIYAQLTWGF